MTDKQIIIEDCPYFVNGVCMEYLDGACKNHKCDLKIIRELEQKLKRKEQECNQLKVENLSLKRGIEIAKEADKSWVSQLKSENKHLNDLLNQALKELEEWRNNEH